MKNIFKKIGLSALAASVLFGAEPATINFQGYLTDDSDAPISGGKSITFKIYDVSTAGTALWTSTKNITITNGVYSTELGKDVVFDLSTMKFDKQYYLGINVENDGEMSPRIAMTNSAYADVFKAVNSSDLNATYLDVATDSDNMPVTLAEVKQLMLNWANNGSLTEAPPTLVTNLSFNGFTYNEIYDPVNKRIWLDRHLGASQACTSHNDTTAECFGDLFQWGRAADGHEKRTSSSVSNQETTLTPNHANFIEQDTHDGDSNPGIAGADYDAEKYSTDWTSASLTAWDGTDNDPCPTGYSIPTKADWETFVASATPLSFLNLPASGYRDKDEGEIKTTYPGIWLSTKTGDKYDSAENDGGVASLSESLFGISVRCIKDQ